MLRKVLAIGVLLGSTHAFAIGDAGCGLGSLIIQKNTKLSQTLAMTTNASTWTQFFGITTGTSNCNASGWVYNEREAKVYADANMPALKVDMARGNGESLTAFAQILGCKGDAVSQFGEVVKGNYGEIFSNDATSSDDVVQSVRSTLNRNPHVAKGCTLSI